MSPESDKPLQDQRSTPEARGRRVESLRRMTRTSRRAFAEKYGIAKTSLQNWEDAIGNGLTEKGARRLVTALKPAGINCTFEWLMYGIGQSPQISELLYLDDVSQLAQADLQPLSSNADEVDKISQELLVFHRHYPKVGIDYTVIDDGMEPRFTESEQVAGCKQFGKQIIDLVGLDCIIQTTEGETLLRNIRKVEKEDLYTLACVNPNTTVDKPILYEVKLLSAAPVIWARRKNLPKHS